ncbi:MAG: hypothetical protein ACRDKV_06760 [Solirubrobacterales bacterium]
MGLIGSKPAAVATALSLFAVAAGCGESGVKRSVDARSEVLQFFAADAPAVAMLRPEPVRDVVELNRAADGVPIGSELRHMTLAPLHAAGLDLEKLRRLVQPQEPIEGIDAAALALGAATPTDLSDRRPLLVLATDQAEMLSRHFRRSEQAGRLRRVGGLDEAVLYRNPVASYGVRDGVLVSARHLPDVRTAIERRDGDSDLRLDEDVVRSLFTQLDTQGPLLVYASLDAVREADLGIRTLAQAAPWTGRLDQTAATAAPAGEALRIEVLSKAAGEGLGSPDLPIGAEPTPFEIDASSAASLIPFEGPIRMLLAGLGPVEGQATASSDEVRLQLTTAP